MKKIHFAYLLSLLLSCNISPKETKLNAPLLNYESSNSKDGGYILKEYGSFENYEKAKFKIEYLQDTIIAHSIQTVNACGKTIGKLKVKNDTIILTTEEIGDELCHSLGWKKYKYWISNPENKKYVILADAIYY